LTRSVAYSSANSGERVRCPDELVGFFILPFSYQLNITGNVHMKGTSITTGSMAKALLLLIDHALLRNRLRKRCIDGTARPESRVVFALHHHGTPLATNPTASALVPIDISRLSVQLHIKVSCLTGDAFDLRVSTEGDVLMRGNLHQFRRKNAHGTIIGGESLIELGHYAPDRRRFFHKVDVIPGFSKV
jgi:hypothetical protein